MKKYKAILWDCDGVLIDSEILSCESFAAYLTDLGYPIDTPTFIETFMGKGRRQILKEVSAETGIDYMPHVDNGEIAKKQRAAFEAGLTATDGIHDLMKAIDLPMAVASGSELERLEHTLALTNLLDIFKGHIYSAEMVEKGKPAPDVFLYAAEKLGVAPEDCLVVEDGIHGIHGAKAAGMDVVAYIGGSHMTAELKKKVLALNPDVVITHISELLAVLSQEKMVA